MNADAERLTSPLPALSRSSAVAQPPQRAAPAISVLLPVYNAAATLPRCLESLLAQTRPDFEVVLVDDGSTDDSAAVAGAFAARDARVRVLRRPHRGIAGALNAGLDACRGAFVARMDADDVAHPRRLAAQHDWLAAHPRCDLVGCLAEPFSRGGPLRPGVRRYHAWMNALRDDAAMKANLFVESPLPHPAFFARRDLFARLGGYRDRPWPEDYDLLHRAAAAGAVFGKVPAVLVRRLHHPARLTQTDPRYRREGMFRAKMHFLVRGPWLHGRNGVVVGGSGTSGRRVAALLREAGVPVRCFLDNKAAPPGRRVMGLPAVGYPDAIPPAFFAAHRDALFLACIGEAEGRARLLRHLHAHGFTPGRDCLLLV